MDKTGMIKPWWLILVDCSPHIPPQTSIKLKSQIILNTTDSY